MSALVYILLIIGVVVAIALFIEKGYNERHADISFIAPLVSARIDKQRLGINKDIFVYNTRETTRSSVLNELSADEQLDYIDRPIQEHTSSRLTKPFATAIAEKSSFATEPISYLYETATSVAALRNTVQVMRNGSEAQYRMLVPSSVKLTAFIDSGNVYIRMRR